MFICQNLGIEVRVRNGTKHVRFIDPQFGLKGLSIEYDHIIDSLVHAGYQRDKNVVAFPVSIIDPLYYCT